MSPQNLPFPFELGLLGSSGTKSRCAFDVPPMSESHPRARFRISSREWKLNKVRGPRSGSLTPSIRMTVIDHCQVWNVYQNIRIYALRDVVSLHCPTYLLSLTLSEASLDAMSEVKNKSRSACRRRWHASIHSSKIFTLSHVTQSVRQDDFFYRSGLPIYMYIIQCRHIMDY